MSSRRLIALMLNVVAVLGPTAALYIRYGPTAAVDARDPAYVLPLVAAVLAAFLIGTISNLTVGRNIGEGFASLFAALANALQGPQPPAHNHKPSRRAA